MVAGRSLDEWSERLFPDVSMRVTDAYDEDSPYSRAVQVLSYAPISSCTCCRTVAACTAVLCAVAILSLRGRYATWDVCSHSACLGCRMRSRRQTLRG